MIEQTPPARDADECARCAIDEPHPAHDERTRRAPRETTRTFDDETTLEPVVHDH